MIILDILLVMDIDK